MNVSIHQQNSPGLSVEVVQRMLEAWQRLDWQQVMDLFAPDAVLHSVMSEPRIGHQAIREEVMMLAEGLNSISMRIKEFGVINDRVFVERVDVFDFAGNHGEVPAVGVFRTSNGLVTEWLEYYDRATLLREMGLRPQRA